MRKQVFILALITALIMSLSASAQADSAGYDITSMTAAYKTVYSVDVREGYLASIIVSTNLSKHSQAENYTQNADKITWTVYSDGSLIRCKLFDAADDPAEIYEADLANLADTKTFQAQANRKYRQSRNSQGYHQIGGRKPEKGF